MKTPSLVLVALLMWNTGCGDDDDARGAQATLSPTQGNAAKGTATFTADGSNVTLKISVTSAPPSKELGFHIHENGVCGLDGMAAGGHWNPEMTDHGAWESGAHHLGDIGNITTDAHGNGTKELTTNLWSIGTWESNDVAGHAFILHANTDDFTTQPTGNAGGRIACGIIQLTR